jgi:hypothetical protein
MRIWKYLLGTLHCGGNATGTARGPCFESRSNLCKLRDRSTQTHQHGPTNNRNGTCYDERLANSRFIDRNCKSDHYNAHSGEQNA